MQSDPRSVVLRPARPEDLTPVLSLLEREKLPATGVAEWLERFIVADNGSIVGVAGLEVHEADGLLRSVAVRDDHRGSGLGGALTERILERSEASGLRAVYLLTETAESFFSRHGFQLIERADVPDTIRSSVEFRELCPVSAVAMVRSIP